MKKISFGLFLSVGILLLLSGVFFFNLGESNLNKAFEEIEWKTRIVIIWGVFGGIVLWMWMLTSFFGSSSKIRFRAMWGWLLVLGSFVGALLYFAVIYLPEALADQRKRH